MYFNKGDDEIKAFIFFLFLLSLLPRPQFLRKHVIGKSLELYLYSASSNSTDFIFFLLKSDEMLLTWSPWLLYLEIGIFLS